MKYSIYYFISVIIVLLMRLGNDEEILIVLKRWNLLLKRKRSFVFQKKGRNLMRLGFTSHCRTNKKTKIF